MALTRKLLKGMGLTEEQIDSIIDAHTDTVNGLKEEIEGHKSDGAKIKELEAKLKGFEGGEDWKQKHDDLKKEYDEYKKGVQAKETEGKVKAAYRELLKSEKVDPDMFDVILRATDFKPMKLEAEGKLENADKLGEVIRSDWAKFIVTEKQKGANVQTPPGSGTAPKKTREEIMAIKDTTERQRAMAENHELFGF